MLKIATNKPPELKVWRTISLTSGDSFDVLLKRPTFDDLMVDRELSTDYTETRIERCVLDWRGVNDENDQPIPYALQTLRDLAVVLPVMVYRIAMELELLYAGLTADAEKNSEKPPADISGAATSGGSATTATDTILSSPPVTAEATHDI
jgi:hypothetical protein